MIRLVIADDQAAVREALEVMLGMVEDIEVVATARTGQRAIEEVREHDPDVVLMDINMPEMNGIEAAAKIHSERPRVAVVILTTFDDDSSILEALRAGALGYLTKDADRMRILQAVRAAALGQSVLDRNVQRRLLAIASARPMVDAEVGVDRVELTKREREILQMIGAGAKNREIADSLHISQATVKTHINNLFSKAGLHSRAEAVRYALSYYPSAGHFERSSGRDD